jgi:hypothetical protein
MPVVFILLLREAFMIDKQVSIDKIEVLENGGVLIRQVTKIVENGEEISRSYHRSSFAPGRDVSDQDARVQAICNAVWTPEVIAAHQNARSASE